MGVHECWPVMKGHVGGLMHLVNISACDSAVEPMVVAFMVKH